MVQWWASLDPEIQAAVLAIFGSLVGAWLGGWLTSRAASKAAREQFERDEALRHRERLEDVVVELRIVSSDLAVHSFPADVDVHPDVRMRFVDLLARSRWLSRVVVARSRVRYPELSRWLRAIEDHFAEALDMAGPDGSLNQQGQQQSSNALLLMDFLLDLWLESPEQLREGSPALTEFEETARGEGLTLNGSRGSTGSLRASQEGLAGAPVTAGPPVGSG